MDLSSPPSVRISPSVRPTNHTRPQLDPLLTDTSRPKAAAPMSIPGSDAASAPPPPLPPPANVEELGLTHESSWLFNNNPNWQGFNPSARPELPGLGRARMGSYMAPDSHDLDSTRRGSTFTVVSAHQGPGKDMQRSRSPSEEGASSTSPNYRLQSERQLEQRTLDTSSQAYDRNLLNKISGPPASATPLRLSSISSTASDVPSLSPSQSDGRSHILHKRLSMPERRRSSNDSRYSTRNNSSASVFTPTSFRSNSIFDPPDVNRPPLAKRHPSIYFDDSGSSHRGSHDSNMFMHEESPMEDGPMKDLNLNDRSPGGSDDSTLGPRAGMKRRASSPRRDIIRFERSSVSSVPGSLEQPRRSIHQLPPRSSPNPRYSYPNHSSISSASSLSNRTASLASSQGLSVASSITSFGSGRLSPNTLSPAALDPELCSPFSASKSLNPSPRSSVSSQTFARHSIDGSNQSDLHPHSHSHPHLLPHPPGHDHRHGTGMPNLHICDCCPKKPKKFSTEEDLRLHHMEKQYTCLYCPNRFKNKNEAERHQNSLHLRRHSWSCAALPSVEAAFHTSTSNNGATDICGYCGDEFQNPADWHARRAHLSHIHKFGECNQIKKFFRADHFRQHLKHSHAGTSGKWTNILENACMRDEPPPQPMHRSSSLGGPPGDAAMYGHSGGGGVSANANGMPAPSSALHKPATIDEVPQEH
ncbi:hypothetical protein K461DRAFT_290627 [Myriangium duriaei CBS 260.36]|uniref:C2H2-type domain-containing protein n=1 Tax=Myriangium duriaei CBS 260.36 TaxID=1168546 RepID=A0A9P4JAU4_9PEZI|nr:hypothetical protein K461DRAFT_290627 [Myriangium duriaei CBS 260.36]